MSSTDRNRGKKEFRKQLLTLREKWPRAFPNHEMDVRPLAVDASREMAAAMGWSLRYVSGVLDRWKMTPAYGEAVLRCEPRINLDGTRAEPIDQPPEQRDGESAANSEYLSEYNKRWSAENPVYHRDKARLRNAKVRGYAPAPGEKDCPPRPTDGRCDCCLRPTAKLLMDHDHNVFNTPENAAANFRGWVCDSCNKILHIKPGPSFTSEHAEYLARR